MRKNKTTDEKLPTGGKDKGDRTCGRTHSARPRVPKRQITIETDTNQIKFALTTDAREDQFAAVFRASRGTVDPKLKLGF
jgi:hypothetical protein